MRRTAILAILALGLNATAVRAATESPLSIKDPSQFVAQLKEMGYAPEPIADKADPGTTLTVNGSTYSVGFGGCDKGMDCRYIVVVGKYSDVIGASADWIAKENADFDYIKVWNANDGMLTYSTGLVVEGMSRETFKSSIELFAGSGTMLAKDALDAKLNK